MITKTTIRSIALGMIASGIAIAATPACAQDAVPQGELHIERTDFTSKASVDDLVKRLHRVAMNICAPDRFADTSVAASEHECYDNAVRNGMAQINAKREMALRNAPVHVAAVNLPGKSGN